MELGEQALEKFFSKFIEKMTHASGYWNEIEKYIIEMFGKCATAVLNFLKWVLDKLIENKQLIAEGFTIGVIKNSYKYLVKMGGRKCNIVQIFDKTVLSSRGNPTWYVRVDKPHGNVPYHHINVNPKITGVPDPHIKISPEMAQFAGKAGEFLSFLNKVAPFLSAILIAFECYDIGTEIKKDFDNGSFRNVVTKVVIKILTSLAGLGGAAGGALIGSILFPGIGMMIGHLVGGMIGAPVLVSVAQSESRINELFDYHKFGIDSKSCTQCNTNFENRRYEEGRQELCRYCRHWTVAIR